MKARWLHKALADCPAFLDMEFLTVGIDGHAIGSELAPSGSQTLNAKLAGHDSGKYGVLHVATLIS